MKKGLMTIILFLISCTIKAQDGTCLLGDHESVVDTVTSVRVEPFDLMTDYYKEASFLAHAYNYDIKNKIKHLRMQRRNVLIAGSVATLGVVAVGSCLAVNNDWSLWAYIPCVSVVAAGIAIPFGIWAGKLYNKAHALEAQVAYIAPISDKIDVGVARYTYPNDNPYDAMGVALRFKF